MDKFLYCPINLFDYGLTVFLHDGSKMVELGDNITRADLTEQIICFCKQHDVHDLLLVGAEANSYKTLIEEQAVTNYGFNDLRIEVKENV